MTLRSGKELVDPKAIEEDKACDTPRLGDPLTNRQPAKDLWMLGNPIPHYCVLYTGTHNLIKIKQSLLCTRSSTQNKPI